MEPDRIPPTLQAAVAPGLDPALQRLFVEPLLAQLRHLHQRAQAAGGRRPLLALNGPVGAGKSTLGRHLEALAPAYGLRLVVASIDDLYCTWPERQRRLHGNPFGVSRVPPGSHDIPLLLACLERWRQRGELRLPRFDKTLAGGQGDRSGWRVERCDAVVLEGWLMGCRPLRAEQLEAWLQLETWLEPGSEAAGCSASGWGRDSGASGGAAPGSTRSAASAGTRHGMTSGATQAVGPAQSVGAIQSFGPAQAVGASQSIGPAQSLGPAQAVGVTQAVDASHGAIAGRADAASAADGLADDAFADDAPAGLTVGIGTPAGTAEAPEDIPEDITVDSPWGTAAAARLGCVAAELSPGAWGNQPLARNALLRTEALAATGESSGQPRGCSGDPLTSSLAWARGAPPLRPEERQWLPHWNRELQAYLPLWQACDGLWLLRPQHWHWPRRWRLQAEARQRRSGGGWLSGAELEALVRASLCSLPPSLYQDPLVRHWREQGLVLVDAHGMPVKSLAMECQAMESGDMGSDSPVRQETGSGSDLFRRRPPAEGAAGERSMAPGMPPNHEPLQTGREESPALTLPLQGVALLDGRRRCCAALLQAVWA